ncbi:uncharacterized protein LOC114313858 isoform X1 [Camellia sinensis]|uniref:uncharacterized protein LOC114313858 isoform X1 n=2 Tax=Camellia sinensis TaxID=4442 RepID=UPI001036A404|nr:uncharacterized protein LOC114313858 isoform X1 [Camellia sinensis]XP_028116076.1 uncharacterized protein LOC114313858 isoform X1 [Camellia sinensis]XP_028116077.1 uncharacterized protein LOC114313858 isoform X1 [Camellia sinensis]
MINCVVFGNNYYISSISSISTITSTSCRRRSRLGRFKSRAFLNKPPLPLFPKQDADTSSVVLDNSLRLLEWDKLCDSVSSFASTSFGKQATKAQLWYLNQTYEESMRLLGETNAVVEMHKHGGCVMDFNGIDVVLVKSAIQHAQRGLPVNGSEAMAIVALLQFAENLQLNLKAAIKEDTEWYQRFMPLAEMIMELVVSRSLVKFVQQLIDEDGSVKDSAVCSSFPHSSALKRLRDQVRMLENKLYQLMDSLIRNKMKETSTVEVSNVDGRMCLRLGADSPTSFEGLLLSSGSGGGSIVEPLSAVPLNDELQQAKASVAKAEADVLLKITEKMQGDLGDIENLFNSMIQLDVINARATYSLSFGGTCPDLFLPEAKDGGLALDALLGNTNLTPSYLTERKWTLYLPRAYHPLLLQQHRQNLRKAMKDVSNATAEIRRRKLQGENMTQREETDINLSALEMQVTKLKQAHPIPVDIFVAQKTKVLVITGPNTGGKTIYLKTVGLAAVMAKSGLHVLASEPVKIPWFDSVFADIGDEQSLSQSLSTFSGHLKQISEILKHSTSRSLVLLDEVGAGTNPLEGAALGMSLLESFAESGPLLTIATTHHGELKTLKYSNDAFENACMEFDEVKLKPTYRILWGVPGRSNAINIAERLGLPNVILDIARKLYGAASAEINEVILEMERLKQNIHDRVSEAQNYLKLSRELHENLLTTRRKVMDHSTDQRYMKMREISEMAAMARSILQKKVRQIRSATQPFQPSVANNNQLKSTINSQHAAADNSDSSEPSIATKAAYSSDNARQSPLEKEAKLPNVGDMVHISSLNKEATVLKVEPSKEEILVQAGKMKLKLKLVDVTT